MLDYGITLKGVNIKRLDTLIDEIHTDLSEGWGVNTKLNPESFLNVLITSFSDKVAELWELGADDYYSMYPSSANGISLDFAAQFGGITREPEARSFYTIHCTGIDGTFLGAGTIIASDTNPSINLLLLNERKITRESFNRAEIKVVTVKANTVYTIGINGDLFKYSAVDGDSEIEILNGLCSALNYSDFKVSVDTEAMLLQIEDIDVTRSNVLLLTENLTTQTVTSLIVFGTENFGNINLPDGAITKIVKAPAEFTSCVNLCGYIAGRETETDSQLRKSYVDKIFHRSSRMIESIRSAILANVQGIESVAVFENNTHEFDELGRYPHCVEVVADGGAPAEIAKQILEYKADGINTFGSVEVEVPGKYDDFITIRFNRSEKVYVWFKVVLTISRTEALPPNYAELIKAVIVESVQELGPNDNVVPQKFMTKLYNAVTGIDYIDISLFASVGNEIPDIYSLRSVTISPRQRAFTDETKIEVVFDA